MFYGIIREPIEIQMHPAPQNDRLDFSFMKDIHAIAEKMARKGRKSVIYESFNLFFFVASKLIRLRLGAQSSYVVKYFEGSNAVKTTSMRN